VAEKQHLRKLCLQRRDDIAVDTARTAAKAAAASALSLVDSLDRLRRVGIYAAFGSELNTSPLARLLSQRGLLLAYPRVAPNSRELEFYETTADALAPGFFGIPEPVPASDRLLGPGDIDAFVVPGLAFDRAGARVGWGRGYYDITLARHADALRIGYAFDLQVVADVPTNPIDEHLDWLVTQSYIHQCPARQRAKSGRSEP